MASSKRLFILCSDDPILKDHLNTLLAGLGKVQTLSLQEALSPQVWTVYAPHLVFFDFIEDENNSDKFEQLGKIIKGLNYAQAKTPQIALGSTEHAASAIQALRNGVSEFLDPGQETELIAAATRLLQAVPDIPTHHNKAKHIVLMGSRPGVGCSTFAAHLSDYLQDCLNDTPEHNRRKEDQNKNQACLVDLGLPIADSLIYLNLSTQFRFTDAIINLHRLDATLISTALPQKNNGLSVLPLPTELHSLNRIGETEIKQLISHFCRYFSSLITDIGGLDNTVLRRTIAESSDEIWLLTDQSVVALVSLSDRLRELHNQNIPKDKIKLIVTKYHPNYGLTDKQIAEQFDLDLIATLPDQTQALLQASSQGKLLTDINEKNAYIKALSGVASRYFSLEKKKKTNSFFRRFIKKA